MAKVLCVLSSPRGQSSCSNEAASFVLNEIRRGDPSAEITIRDLSLDPPPHIDADFVAALAPEGARSERQKAFLARSDAFVQELLDADIVVIAAAMINLGIPSTLKAWIDHITIPGRTFAYREDGVQGLVTGKKAIVVVARGGVYSEAPAKAYDFQLPYLKGLLGFLGFENITAFEVEGTALGPEQAARAVAETARRIQENFAAAA